MKAVSFTICLILLSYFHSGCASSQHQGVELHQSHEINLYGIESGNKPDNFKSIGRISFSASDEDIFGSTLKGLPLTPTALQRWEKELRQKAFEKGSNAVIDVRVSTRDQPVVEKYGRRTSKTYITLSGTAVFDENDPRVFLSSKQMDLIWEKMRGKLMTKDDFKLLGWRFYDGGDHIIARGNVYGSFSPINLFIPKEN